MSLASFYKARALLFFRMMAVAAVCCLLAAPAHARMSYFVNHEVRSANLKPFPKWTGMMSRYFNDTSLKATPCGSARFDICKLKEWEAFLKSQQGKPLREQVDAVNRFHNIKKYIIDPINWGVNDYWATPFEFQRKNGDCEDYAISKFISLRALGVPNDKMRIMVLQDLNLNVMHAILIVFIDKDVVVLDNQAKEVKRAIEIYHYKPIYSINETSWWRHIMVQK